MSSEYDEINQIIIDLEKINKEISNLVTVLIAKNKKLQDEVDSLWAMMDEITKSDIKNFSNILEDLEKDVLVRTLMITKKRALC